MKSLRIVSAIALGAGLLVVAMPSAQAATINVSAGQSIQTAIDNANPGDTINIGPGTFHEAVVAYKDDLTIAGHNTIIQPPASAAFGLCVSSTPGCEAPPGFIDGVSVSGITVQKSAGDGFVIAEARNVTLSNDRSLNNKGSGFVAVVTFNATLTQDVATGNGVAGFELVLGTANTLTSDQATNNDVGFLMVVTGQGTLRNSIAKSNCYGVVLLLGNDGQVSNNVLTQNTRACPANSDIPLPATKGVGALAYGAQGLLFTHNALQGNGKATSNTATGGLVISDTPSGLEGNVFSENSFAKNLPVDIRTDSTDPADDSFANNACSISVPSGIC